MRPKALGRTLPRGTRAPHGANCAAGATAAATHAISRARPAIVETRRSARELPLLTTPGELPCPRVRAVPMGSAGSRASSEAEAEEGGIARVFCGEPEIACCSAHRREMGEHDGCEDGTESDSIDLPQFAWPWEALSGLDPADYSLTLAELDVRCHEAEKEVRTAKVCSGLHQRASFLSSLSDALSVALSSAYRAGLDTTLPAMGTRMEICTHKHAHNKHTNMHVRTHTRAHGHAPPHVLTWMYAIYFTLLSQCI